MKNIHVLPTDKLSRIFYDISVGKLKLSPYITEPSVWFDNRHIYITSDEAIKEGDWYLHMGQISKRFRKNSKAEYSYPEYQKIILTTDQDLIKDGVQAIDDEFLEWFINNPTQENIDILKCPIEGLYTIDLRKEKHKQHILSCCKSEEECYCGKNLKQESIQEFIEKHGITEQQLIDGYKQGLELIFENASKVTKQETLEEAAERLYPFVDELALKKGFIHGAKWQAEQMYSEEDMISFATWLSSLSFNLQHFNEKGLKPFNELLPMWFEQFKKK